MKTLTISILWAGLLGLILNCSSKETPPTTPPKQEDSVVQLNIDTLPQYQRDSLALARILDSNHIPQEKAKQVATWIYARIYELNFDNLELERIPKEIKYLDALVKLSAAHTNLKSIETDSIQKLATLVSIDFSDCKFDSIPEKIGELKALVHLDLSTNNIKRLPKGVTSSTILKHLNLANNENLISPDSMTWGASALNYLNMSNCGLTNLFTGLSSLSSLDTLILQSNRINLIPEIAIGLPRIRVLNLDGNAIDTVPPNLGSFSTLENLSMVGNQIRGLAVELTKLRALKVFNLSNNNLVKWPSMGPFATLKTLIVSNNRFEFLPTSLGENKALEELYANGNRILQLPYTISELAQLHTLNLKDNKIITVPPPITNLKKLKLLLIDGNKGFCYTQKDVGEYIQKIIDISIDSCPALDGMERPYSIPSVVNANLVLYTLDSQTLSRISKPIPNQSVFIHKSNDSLVFKNGILSDAQGKINTVLNFGTYYFSYYYYYPDQVFPTSNCTAPFSIVNLNDTLYLNDLGLGYSIGFGCASKITFPETKFLIKAPDKKDTTLSLKHILPKSSGIEWPKHAWNYIVSSFCPRSGGYSDSTKYQSEFHHFFAGKKREFIFDKKIDTTYEYVSKMSRYQPEVQCNIPPVPYSNRTDDDLDGCVDEEIWDGKDNDGDGMIDEDVLEGTYKNITIQHLLDPSIVGGDSVEVDGTGRLKFSAPDTFWTSTGKDLNARLEIGALNIPLRTKDTTVLNPAMRKVGGCWKLYPVYFK